MLEDLLLKQELSALDTLQLAKMRFKEGVVGKLDVLQQEGLLEEIRAQIPMVQSEGQRARLRLNVLLGRSPESELFDRVSSGFPDVSSELRISEPLELLAERPDLRRSRNELISADFAASQAFADRWPQLVLDFDLVWRESDGTSKTILTVAGRLFQSIFDAGRLKSDEEGAIALREESRALFAADYLNALSELQGLVFEEDRQNILLGHLEVRERLLSESASQATERYDQGLTDYLPVITARQSLLTIQQRLVRERRNLVRLRIALYHALGGTPNR